MDKLPKPPVVMAFDDPNAKFYIGRCEIKQHGFFSIITRILHMNEHWVNNNIPDDVQ